MSLLLVSVICVHALFDFVDVAEQRESFSKETTGCAFGTSIGIWGE